MSDIRKMDAVNERVETGVVQFGDDWPGLFIRGDNCFAYKHALRQFLENPKDYLARAQVEGLLNLLSAPIITG